jgi:hypothetical protein
VLVLGDVLLAVAAATKAKPTPSNKTAASAAANSTASAEPVCKKYTVQRMHLEEVEKDCRKLENQILALTPAVTPLPPVLSDAYARIICRIYHLIHYAAPLLVADSSYSYSYVDAKVCVVLDQHSVKMTPSALQLGVLADLCTMDRSVQAVQDAEVCHLLRVALGCAKLGYLNGSTGL